MLGWNEERREGVPRGDPGTSPRRDELDDFLPSAGEEERFRLATLGLRLSGLAAKLGDEGVRRRSAGFLGDERPGDCGRAVLEAVWSDRRFSGSERRLASLFVCCAARRGVPG